MKSVLAWVTLLLSLVGCSGETEDPATAAPTALVTLASAVLGDVAETAIVYGEASAGPASERALVAPVESIIVTIQAPLGARVEAGQAIVTLRPSPVSALATAQASNDAAQTQAAFARAQRLRVDGLMSDADVESARAAAAGAAALRASLTRRTAELTLRAPTAGTVQMLGGSAGDLLAAGTPVVRLAMSTGVRARFGIDPALARVLKPGADIQISPAAETAGFKVQVASVDPVADPQTRLAALYAPLPAQANIARGEILRGSVTVELHSQVVTVPYAALLDDGGEAYVFVIEDEVAKRQVVTTGAEENGLIEIRSGLAAGAQVVISGGTSLEDGMPVRRAE